jgi:hypothetical protein
MFSRSTRVSVVLVSQIQLGVWGFYAPAHRLMHHTHPAVASPTGSNSAAAKLAAIEPKTSAKCHSGCCSHHGPQSVPSRDPSNDSGRCSTNANECEWCLIACQSGSQTAEVELMVDLTRVEPLTETAVQSEPIRRSRLFDSRGPPSA